MKRSEQEFELAGRIVARFELACDACFKTDDQLGMDVGEAASGFYEDGWRVKGIWLRCRRRLRKFSNASTQ